MPFFYAELRLGQETGLRTSSKRHRVDSVTSKPHNENKSRRGNGGKHANTRQCKGAK